MRKRWLEKSCLNNLTIALRLLYAKKEKIYPDYVSRFNSEREKQVVFFHHSKWRCMTLSCNEKSIIQRNKSLCLQCLQYYHLKT